MYLLSRLCTQLVKKPSPPKSVAFGTVTVIIYGMKERRGGAFAAGISKRITAQGFAAGKQSRHYFTLILKSPCLLQ